MADRRILLVEDHQDSAIVLRAFLTVKGFDCQVCPHGGAALEALVAFDPFAVILDVGLPQVSGIELAKAIRGRANGDRYVLVGYSGYGQVDDRQRAHYAGMDAYFVKPADVNEILAAIERIAATKAPLRRAACSEGVSAIAHAIGQSPPANPLPWWTQTKMQGLTPCDIAPAGCHWRPPGALFLAHHLPQVG